MEQRLNPVWMSWARLIQLPCYPTSVKIGIALFIERFGYSRNIRGLGLGGAIAINLCAGTILLVWLVTGSLDIPSRGYIFLWAIVILVFRIGIAELVTKSWYYE